MSVFFFCFGVMFWVPFLLPRLFIFDSQTFCFLEAIFGPPGVICPCFLGTIFFFRKTRPDKPGFRDNGSGAFLDGVQSKGSLTGSCSRVGVRSYYSPLHESPISGIPGLPRLSRRVARRPNAAPLLALSISDGLHGASRLPAAASLSVPSLLLKTSQRFRTGASLGLSWDKRLVAGRPYESLVHE